MRLTLICGLDHVEPSEQNNEARRILAELSNKIYTESPALKHGDTFILRDINGNRIGIVDVTNR